MDDPNMTMEEYVQLETEKALSIPFEPSQFYKDGACMKCYGGQDITTLPPRAERHLWLRLLIRELILEFFSTCRLEIVCWIWMLLIPFSPTRAYWDDSLREIASKAHLLIAFSIAGRGQTPEKVTTTKLLYLRSINEGITVNVPYFLAYYLFRHALGRKQGVRMFGEVCESTMIDIDELVGLRICDRLRDVVTWVAMGPERQQDGAVAGAAHVDPEGAHQGVKANPTPTKATQILQATAPAP
nr:hypothetical protein [Tanacetum cinerariifolium]